MGKNETLQGLSDARQKILDAVNAAPPEKRAEIFLGKWSVKDLLAHLIGWDYSNIESVHDIRAGKPPRVFEHFSPDWVAYNAQLVKQYKRDDWKALLQALDESHRALIGVLEKIPAEDFAKDLGARSPRGRTLTIAHHLQAEIEDEQEHAAQIRAWLAAA